VGVDRNDLEHWLVDQGIHTIRIEGTNLDGSLMGKFLSPAKFLKSLDSGVALADLAFGVDLQNTPYWGFAHPEWRGEIPDIFLRPDLSTLVVWRPGLASVIGDFWLENGSPLPVCPRNMLKRVVGQLAADGFGALVAIEIEATVFEESIHVARVKGYRGLSPLGGLAGFAYHLTKDAGWEEYMHAVTHRLNEIGIPWEVWNDEAAVGQIELNLAPSDPVTMVDNWARTRQVMREVSFDLGRTVTFMAKWCDAYGQASHVNVSLSRNGSNTFFAPDGPSETMRHFIGGLMATLKGTTSISMPWITSYWRLSDLQGPPTTLSWGIRNKSTALRAVVGDAKASRIEYRVPGADSNCYFVLAAVLGAGRAGVARAIEPPPATAGMAWANPAIERIPSSITKAALALAEDDLLAEVLGKDVVDYWIGTRRWEWMSFHTGGGDPDEQVCAWESTRYFELV
jgi:glutamine synthetase